MNTQLLLLILAVAALLFAGRLIAGGFTVRNLLHGLVSWAAIALVGFIALTHQTEIAALIRKVSTLGAAEQVVEGDTIRIPMSRDGHFWATVRLNGVERRMLVDSGATVTALSEDSAAEAGIVPGRRQVILETANGSIAARSGIAERVSVGPLVTRDLKIVVAPTFGEFDVLGMNFLSRLKSWRVEGRTLILEPGKPTTPESSRRRPSSEVR